MKIGIMGAGAVGCYVGGRLAASGVSVVLIGRPALVKEVGAEGLQVTDYLGFDARVASSRVEISSDPSRLSRCDIVAIAVKSIDTPAAAEQLARVLNPEQIVISLQNGIRNVPILRAALARSSVLAAMVQFNVVRPRPTAFHCAMKGRIVVEDHPGVHAAVAAMRGAGIECSTSTAVTPILWGKLLFNLNNAVNALSGLPLRTMMSQRPYRLIMADAIEEAVQTLKEAEIPATLTIPIPASWLPGVLRLPNPVFGIAAKKMLAIDPTARASMSGDLEWGRKTEVDFLNGEIVELARRLGLATPVNSAIVGLVHAAEDAGRGSPALSASDLNACLRASR